MLPSHKLPDSMSIPKMSFLVMRAAQAEIGTRLLEIDGDLHIAREMRLVARHAAGDMEGYREVRLTGLETCCASQFDGTSIRIYTRASFELPSCHSAFS